MARVSPTVLAVCHQLVPMPDNYWRWSPEKRQVHDKQVIDHIEKAANDGNPVAVECLRSMRRPTKRRNPSKVSLPGRLAVVTCYFNPVGYASRAKNAERFYRAARSQGADLWTVEAVLPGQQPLCPPAKQTLQTSLPDVLWVKENLLNLVIRSLPDTYDKVAWVDTDLLFDNPHWVDETAEKLQSHPVVQLFDTVLFLDEHDVPVYWFEDTLHRHSIPYRCQRGKNAKDLVAGHCGMGWAARRDALGDRGLYEHHICGSGDAIMCAGFYGWWDHGIVNRHRANKAMTASILDWGRPIYEQVQGDVGYTPGTVRHMYHGTREDRQYDPRLDALRVHRYDPAAHLEKTSEGVFKWSDRAPDELKRRVAAYFASRNEDRGVNDTTP